MGIMILAAALVVLASVVKYRDGDINYIDSDATWHTLLTIQAYNETPISQHLFLPLISLGGPDDKWISWGATIPDNQGNFYYTSFSPASFFGAWFFMKLFSLPVEAKSLYLFNVVLFAASACLWGWLIWSVYENRESRGLLAVIGVITYIFVPELLHGMGIVYWAHSLMQLTLLIQICAYYRMKKSRSGSSQLLFYLFALANPYIEWTGYVANVGFAIGELAVYWKEDKKKAFVRAGILGGITAASFGIYVMHYLLRVQRESLFVLLKARFLARGVSGSFPMTNTFGKYADSFLWLWVLLLVLAGWSIGEKKKIEFQERLLMFVMAFPVLENVIMKEHAYYYSYDRMKGIYLFSFLICQLVWNLLEKRESKKRMAGLVALAGVCCCLNFHFYKNGDSYLWEEGYLKDNRILAEYVNQEYGDSVLALEGLPVRGYLNLLFHRGIYENMGAESACGLGADKGKRYAVVLEAEDIMYWNMYDLGGASVYDLQTGAVEQIVVRDGQIQCKGSEDREENGTAREEKGTDL